MDTQAVEEARRWLAERGIVEAGRGWVDAEESGQLRTASEIAHSWASEVLTGGCLDVAGQARLAFGLLDLLDDYWDPMRIEGPRRSPGCA
jgi:hypothetical protein